MATPETALRSIQGWLPIWWAACGRLTSFLDTPCHTHLPKEMIHIRQMPSDVVISMGNGTVGGVNSFWKKYWTFFGQFLGYLCDIFRDILGHSWDIFGTLLGHLLRDFIGIFLEPYALHPASGNLRLDLLGRAGVGHPLGTVHTPTSL
jgi:hypothetical protein